MNEQEMMNQIKEAAEKIQSVAEKIPEVCLVLGSGLGPLSQQAEVISSISYKDVPHFPQTTVPGHDGVLEYALFGGIPMFIMKGRFHYYEGYSTTESSFYVRVMAYLGVKTLVLTNAAGGIAPGMKPGELMVVSDHIGLFCESPLRGPNLSEFGPRFPDQSEVYDHVLMHALLKCAYEENITLHQGTYCYTKGPQYETPAEIRALRTLGVSAVGMSTVAEAIVARHSGMKVLAMSCISNLAAGISPTPLSHNEVITNAAAASETSIR
ncbi:MAG TPA: purine-nucleoside phosphorylase, partial [Bacillota bacterium]|nr:purine-nucleoside phosphorylase [Bacillota bacterium]